jgi:hypothetical protein
MVKIAQQMPSYVSTIALSKFFAVECVMNINERQIALSVLESLRGDLMYAHLENGSRVLDVADLRQYIYEHMSRIRTSAFAMDGLYADQNDHRQDLGKSNGRGH